MRDNQRKCLKCGSSPGQDPATPTTLYRFPKPDINNSLLCQLWAKFCFPDREWYSRTFQQILYDEHRMLCHKHFEQASFTDYSQKKLHKHASPTDRCDKAPSVTAETLLQEHNYCAPPALTDTNTLPSTGACGDVRPIHNVEGPAAKSCNEVCRICLAADRKMIVLDTKHKQLYESVTGIAVQPTDRLPKHICWECNHFMSKLMSFQIKAVTSHYILKEILTKQNNTFTTLEEHQPKSTMTCTSIWYSKLDGVEHEELDEIADEIADEDVLEIKNEADHIWDEERNFISYVNGEINIIRDNKPIDYTYDEADLTKKESVEIGTNIEITKESVDNVSNIEILEEIVKNEYNIEIIDKAVKTLNNVVIPEDIVKNDIDIETTEKTVINVIDIETTEKTVKKHNNNEILDNLRGDYIDDDKNASCVFNGSDGISSKIIKNISCEPVDETSKSKRKLELDKSLLPTVTRLCKEKQIRHVEEHFKTPAPADGPRCERCALRLASQEAFDDHETCSANLADTRTTKITPRLAEPMVVNGIQFAKSPRVELRKYYAPPGYAPLFGAPLKKPKADSLKVNNSSKTSHEAVYSDANVPELSKRTKHLEEAKEKANCTETVVGDSCKDKFICDECGQQFHKKYFIILHMKTKHVKDIDIRFQKYAYSSVAKGRLEKHSKINCEKRKYICDECNNRFISKNSLKRHKRRCGIKNNVSNTHSALEPYSCTKCGMRTHTGEKPYSCTVCKKQFSQSGHLKTHMRTHTGEKPYVCTVCNKQFSLSGSLSKHMRTHTGEKPYLCTVCKKQFSFCFSLRTHMRTHTGEKPYSCKVCSKQFSQSINLKTHIRTHTGEKPYSCTVCKKQFSQSSILNNHMRTHTGEKPYSCTVCNKQFSKSCHLKTHMRTHTGEKPYVCTVCNKQFSLSGSLSKHMRTHTGEKPYLCTVCKKQFSFCFSLRTHMRTHTGEKPYSCKVCSKQFSQSINLKTHIRTHTGEKPYSCTVCKKQFSQSSILNNHMRTHTGDKPFSCTVCKKQFSESGNFNRHVRTHTGEKPYSCTVCNKQFSRNGGLNTHMITHTGDKPYSCSVCKKQFSYNSHWRRHSKQCQ